MLGSLNIDSFVAQSLEDPLLKRLYANFSLRYF